MAIGGKKRFAGIVINETSIDVDDSRYSAEPLGLEYALAVAQDEGWEISLFDNLMYANFEEFNTAIKDFKPDMAGFSVFDNCRNASLTVARELKKQGVITLFGGYHPSGCPEIALKDEVDFVIIGEAERTLPQLLQNLDSLSVIPNLAYKDNGKLHLNLDCKKEKLPTYRPVRNEFYLRQADTCLNYPAPSDQTGVAHISINRGCKNHCVYCSVKAVYQGGMIEGDLDHAISQIKDLKGQDVNLIIFDDPIFTLDNNFIERFCHEMRPIKDVYFEMFGHLGKVTPEMMGMLYNAGMRKIELGIESLDKNVLDFMGRNADLQKLKALLTRGYDLGILTTCFYQIGYPQDTQESINENIGRLIQEELFIPRLRISVATPTSGSRWYNQLKEQNSDWPREEDWNNFDCEHLVYQHDSLEPKDIGLLRDEMEKKYYKSDFYQRKLELFVKKHLHLKKTIEECRQEK